MNKSLVYSLKKRLKDPIFNLNFYNRVNKISYDCPNELGDYSKMIELKFPSHMYKNNGGYYTEKESCLVDACMVDEIKYLWEKGIVTTGCCCGHGIAEPMINVAETEVDKMVKLGYKLMNVSEGKCKETFKAKSKHIGL